VSRPPDRLAVVPVRGGVLPAGAIDAVVLAGGRALLVGDGTAAAAAALAGATDSVGAWEAGTFAPASWAAALASLVGDRSTIVLPASPDGRDLAPRLAAELERPLLAGVVEVRGDVASTACFGGALLAEHRLAGPVVLTVQPGPAPAEDRTAPPPTVEQVEPVDPVVPGGVTDAEVLEVLPPDVATMDLAEAPRILGGGAGLDSPERFDVLAEVAAAIGASTGATRVVTDRGWLPHSRQIGTTGVVVAPELYLAFGISGAVQHTAGLGDPEHVISVNTDPHCPMASLADLAVVADANATLDELRIRLARGTGEEIGA
jgi:electron transfer flavoprotein alpha subunit